MCTPAPLRRHICTRQTNHRHMYISGTFHQILLYTALLSPFNDRTSRRFTKDAKVPPLDLSDASQGRQWTFRATSSNVIHLLPLCLIPGAHGSAIQSYGRGGKPVKCDVWHIDPSHIDQHTIIREHESCPDSFSTK